MKKNMRLLSLIFFPAMLSGCVSLEGSEGISSYPPEETRSLEVTIQTNDENLKVEYSNYTDSDVPFMDKFNEHISTGDFSGEIIVPREQRLSISAYGYDKVNYYTEGYTTVTPEDDEIKAEINIFAVAPKLREITSSLDSQQKTHLLRVLGLYDEAIASPRHLIETRHARAKSELDIFYRESETRYTELSQYMSKIDSIIYTATLPAVGGPPHFEKHQALMMVNKVRHAI